MAWFQAKYERVRRERVAVESEEKRLGRGLTLQEVEDLMEEIAKDYPDEILDP